MLEFFTDTITLAAIIGIALAAITRFIPNDKLYGWGFTAGRVLNGFGSARMGSATWEKLESFLQNSIGEYLRGVKNGLDENDPKKDDVSNV